ncbi:hypothetical protein ACJJIG_02520 [Microbulbifer sp. SSSA007]|uniref:hypothetical protein n=1 Tax=Microbulbifer sp. SSSA007 TaxID=3243379 RepID=UPI004039AC4E
MAKLSGGEYQFVIEGPRALVTVFDSEFEANEDDVYVLKGALSSAGEFGLFPGIKVHEITKA